MRIRYVGKKPFNLDRMYGSNGLWVGHGDIQVVEDEKIAQHYVQRLALGL